MKGFFAPWSLAIAASLIPGAALADAFDQWSDPTRPYTGAAIERPAEQAGFVLQYTLVSPQRRIAVINGRRYATGSKLANWEVAAIDTNEVVLRDRDKEKRLQLLPPMNIKQPILVEAKRHVARP